MSDAPLEVRDDQGKLRRLTPLGLNDFDTLGQDIRASRLASANDYLNTLPPDERIKLAHAILTDIVGTAEILEECGTPDRMLRILHLSLIKGEPGLTLKQVRNSFGEQTIPQVLDLIMILSGLVQGGEEDEGADPPSPTGTASLPTSSNTTENEKPQSEVGASAKSS